MRHRAYERKGNPRPKETLSGSHPKVPGRQRLRTTLRGWRAIQAQPEQNLQNLAVQAGAARAAPEAERLSRLLRGRARAWSGSGERPTAPSRELG